MCLFSGKVHEFAGEAQKISGEVKNILGVGVQNNLRGGAHQPSKSDHDYVHVTRGNFYLQLAIQCLT